MSKYMVTVQHRNQRVGYIEFNADNDKQAKENSVDFVNDVLND